MVLSLGASEVDGELGMVEVMVEGLGDLEVLGTDLEKVVMVEGLGDLEAWEMDLEKVAMVEGLVADWAWEETGEVSMGQAGVKVEYLQARFRYLHSCKIPRGKDRFHILGDRGNCTWLEYLVFRNCCQ